MRPLALVVVAALLSLDPACRPAAPESGPLRYRLADSGSHWDVVRGDHVLDDLRPRYPEFFEQLLDPSQTHEDDLLELRDHLEQKPVDRRNYDALNALAIGYFELTYRSEAQRGQGLQWMSHGFRSAKLLAVPWRAYGEIEDPALRSAILDFFDDAASGEKLGSRPTAPRLQRVVADLADKETDVTRRRRIGKLVAGLQQLEQLLIREAEAAVPSEPVADGDEPVADEVPF